MKTRRVEADANRPCLPGAALLASLSDSFGAKHREVARFSSMVLAQNWSVPGNAFARMRALSVEMQPESPVVMFYGGVYQTVRQLLKQVSKTPGSTVGKEVTTELKNRVTFRKEEAELLFRKGVEFEKALDIQSAIAYLEQACELQPNNVEYLARLSKQWSDISFAPGVKAEKARELNREALRIAEQIMVKDPKSALGNIALCVSKGRLAHFSDIRTKIYLAQQAEDVARRAVIWHPRNDLLHHLLGRWHYEMAGLNMFARAIVRIVYGATLHPGSYQGALQEMEQAARLAPHRAIHFVEMGKAHWKLGDRDQAIAALQHALELEMIDINDYLEVHDGAKLLKRIRGVRRLPWERRTRKAGPIRPLFCE